MLDRLLKLLRGPEGHPLHPPLTDATLGAFTAGAIAVFLGWVGIAEESMAVTGYLAIVVGLVLSLPTIVTGFADYVRLRRGTALWRTASLHWLVMVPAVGVFLVAAALLQDAWDERHIDTAGALAALAAEGLLVLGGWLGGTVVFVHGLRVLDLQELPARKAIAPSGAEDEQAAS
jgi:uncharacterized membrane protein